MAPHVVREAGSVPLPQVNNAAAGSRTDALNFMLPSSAIRAAQHKIVVILAQSKLLYPRLCCATSEHLVKLCRHAEHVQATFGRAHAENTIAGSHRLVGISVLLVAGRDQAREVRIGTSRLLRS